MGEYTSLINELMFELTNSPNLEKMLNISENILGTPIAFNDLSLNILVHSTNYPVDDIEDRINVRKSAPINERDSFITRCKIAINDGMPHLVYWPFMRRNQIMCGGLVNGKLAGYITIPSMSKPLESLDSKLIKLVANSLSTAFFIKRNPNFKEYSTYNHDLLYHLLEEKNPSTDNYSNVYWNAFDNISSYRILWIPPIDNKSIIVQYEIIKDIASDIKYWWQIPYDEGYAVMTDGYESLELKKLDRALKEKGILIGSSDVFYNLKETRENFRIAKNVLSYAHKMGKTSGMAYFNDYKVFYLLSYVSSHIGIKNLQHNALNSITKYDKENKTEYLLTLSTYIYSNLNIKETAAKLHLHKNTVSYRISKISELFKLDLDNINVITSLYLSLLLEDKHLDSNIY